MDQNFPGSPDPRRQKFWVKFIRTGRHTRSERIYNAGWTGAYPLPPCQIDSDSHGYSSSAVPNPPCLSSKAIPLARMKAPICSLMMPLDSRHSPLQRSHAWSLQNRCRLSHTPPRMSFQKYAPSLTHINLRILKGFWTGPLEANLTYHQTYRHTDEREHHL